MHRRIWRYLGDLRCPCHRRYGKIYTSGRGNNMVLRLECRVTGKIWMKTLYSRWVEENEFNREADDRFAELREIAAQLKGGETNG